MHVSICGELGAGCTEVGLSLSKKQGIKCVNSADLMKSIVIGFRGVHPEESFKEFESHIQSGEVDLDKMIDGRIDELLDQEKDLIVEGRTAFMLLDNTNVFKVLLVAPQKNRAKHIAKSRGISLKEAQKKIQRSDIERKHMVERLFKKDWLDPHNYDIVLNTGILGHQKVTSLISDII
jgi:cytidylate kinase